MTLRELFDKMRIGDSVNVRVTVLGYTEETKRYYSFYTYYNEWGLNRDLFEKAPNNILDCEIAQICVTGAELSIDVSRFDVPEEALEEEEP